MPPYVLLHHLCQQVSTCYDVTTFSLDAILNKDLSVGPFSG